MGFFKIFLKGEGLFAKKPERRTDHVLISLTFEDLFAKRSAMQDLGCPRARSDGRGEDATWHALVPVLN